MSVTQNSGLGEWSIRLSEDIPLEVLDALGWFGHVAITTAREDVRLSGDAVLSSARYVGVLRKRTDQAAPEIGGPGMAMWLGDEDDKGHIFEAPKVITNQSFSGAIAALLPPSVQPGTLHSVAGANYSGTHQYQTPRKAMDYVSGLFDAAYRVNGNGTVDAGTMSQLYGDQPRAAIIARRPGTQRDVRSIEGRAKLDSDVEDFTTRTLLLAQTLESTIATGAASIDPALNPHRDLFGNPVTMTRMISESTTSEGNATARAQLQLNRFTSPRDAVTLNTETHHVEGRLAYGEVVWCYDLDAGLYDLANEVQWQGEKIHPVQLRVSSLTWPVAQGMGVYYRAPDGTWMDLTDYVTWESGQTNVTVGGYARSLVTTGSESVPVRVSSVPQPNTSIPAAPVLDDDPLTSVYLSEATGLTRAQVQLEWTRPGNTDGSAITDGDYFEVRYRSTSQAVLPATHQQMSGYTHDELNTHASPIPFTTSGWSYLRVPWFELSVLVAELAAGSPYEFQVRTWDIGQNPSDWSNAIVVQTRLDNLPPEAPAPPVVAGNRLALMIRHDLGRAEGGTFNLARDLNHLEVHAEYEPLFEPIAAPPTAGGTLIGKLGANAGMLAGRIPAVGSFNIENTGAVCVKVVAVDNDGNKSRPSAPVQATAQLVDSAHITDLTASKITAGTMSAAYTVSGFFTTGGGSGTNRAFMSGANGFYAYNDKNELTFWAGGPSGMAQIRGRVETGGNGQQRIIIDPASQEQRFYPVDGSNQYVRIKAYSIDQPLDPADAPGLDITTFDEQGKATGANIAFTEDYMTLGLRRNDALSPWASYHTMDTTGAHWFYGHFGNNFTADGQAALFVGYWEIAAGFSAFILNYGATMASLMIVTYSIQDNFDMNPSSLVGSTNTGFTVKYTHSRAVVLHYQCMRVDYQ